MTLIKLALRNIQRHLSKSLIISSIIILASFILTFGNAYGESILQVMTQSLTDHYLGELVIHQNGLLERPDFLEYRYPAITDSKRVKDILYRPEVTAYSERIKWVGLLMAGELTQSVSVLGIDPKTEQKTFPALTTSQGRFLTYNDNNGVLVSQELITKNHWRLGQEVTLITTAADGYPSALNLKISGILKPNGFDYFTGTQVYITKGAAAKLSYLSQPNEIAVRLREPSRTAELGKLLTKSAKRARLSVQVQTNQEFAPLVWSIAQANKLPWRVLGGLIMAMIIVGILMMLVASILERFVEFGAMLALGCTRRQLYGLIFWEVLIIGFVSALTGSGLALLFIGYFHSYGLPAFINLLVLSYGGDRLYMITDWLSPLLVIGLVTTLSLLAAVYPVCLLKKLNPIEALRTN